LIGRKAMRRRIADNAEMSGQNYFKEEAAKEMASRNDQRKVPQYAEFENNKPVSPDRLPLNPPHSHIMTKADLSVETISTGRSSPASFRVALPPGPNPYGGGGYPPAVSMPRPYGPVPPVRTPSDRPYPLPPGPTRMGTAIPASRSNPSLNSTNMPPRSNYETPVIQPPAVVLDRRTPSAHSDYVPPRRQWGAAPPESRSLRDQYPDTRPYRPEGPKIDTRNLDRTNRMVDNPYVVARPRPAIDRAPVNRGHRRSTSDSGTMVTTYYEDVDPRFDDNPEELESRSGYRMPLPLANVPSQQSRRLPPRFDVGDKTFPGSSLRQTHSDTSLRGNGGGERLGTVDDEDRSGPRSPTASTSSHFTSVSQRGVNPRWQSQSPPRSIGGNNNLGVDGMYTRRNNRPRNDQMNFLSGNPDFELPVNRSGKRGGPIGGGSTPVSSSMDGGRRYPLPI